MNAFDRLARALFDGPTPAADIKLSPGSGSADERAEALLASMERMGLLDSDGFVINPNNQQSTDH